MITNFIILVYLASWTLFILLIILIGYILDKSYKLASISPLPNNKNPAETTFAIQPITSKIQSQTRTQQLTRFENNELEDFFNNPGDNSPNLNQDDQFYSNGEKNITEQTSPVRLAIDPKQVSSPRLNRTPQRSNTLRKTILRKPTIGTYEGMETVQTTNRRSLRAAGKQLSQIQSDRSSIGDFTPRSTNQKQQQYNQPRTSQFSVLGKAEAIKLDSNYQIPKPENDLYKCHQFSKIFYSHKEGISRIFMILTIYFRQLICLDVCGLLIYNLSNLNFWIIIGITTSISLLLKISDYYTIKGIVHHHNILKYFLIVFWISSIGIMIWLIIFLSPDNLQWFIQYLPSLLLDLIVIDPFKYFMIKYCLQEPKKIREPKSKVDVLKVMQQIK